MLVHAKFLDETGNERGKPYTYTAPDDMAVGELATTPEGARVILTAINLSPDAAREFSGKIKGVLRVVDAEPSEQEAEQGFDVNELIIVEQLPVIKEQLKLISEDIKTRVEKIKAMPVTGETVKEAKKERAALRKVFAVFEERRKMVKNVVTAPYIEFEDTYKQYISDVLTSADNILKEQIDAIEKVQKETKAADVKTYFNEYAKSKHIDIVAWEQAGIKVGLSDSPKSLKEQAAAFIDRVESDLMLIETQEHKEEILVEYKKTLNVSLSITSVKSRHKAIEEQKVRQAEIAAKKAAEAEATKKVETAVSASVSLAPPVVKKGADNDPVKTLKFKVRAPISKLKELRKFLDENGYECEAIQ